MAFNRPGNSRDNKSGRSSGKTSRTNDRPKKPSSSTGNSAFSTDRNHSSTPSRKYNTEQGGERKGPAQRSRPYTGRPADEERPKRSYGSGAADERRPSSALRKPYSGRVTPGDEKPKRSFGGESGEGKKTFSARKSAYTGSSSSDDKPKRSFGGGSSEGRKTFSPRKTSYGGSSSADDKPKRSFGGDRTDAKRTTERPPSSGGSFKKFEKPKRENKPERSASSFDEETGERTGHLDKTLRGRKKSPAPKDSGLIRLNRYISNAGICSRRKADELIAAGVVSVNGQVVSELGHKVDPQKDEIKYNGETLRREKMVYVLLNKPKDYITTTEDPHERRTVMHLVEKASRERIYPIGRLDRNTTGLLLMTNDGDLADKLSHPRNNVVKLYHVELNKSLTQGDLNKIAFGLELEDGVVKPDSVSYVAGASKREVGIQIHSGKNRIVRRIFEHLGYEVVRLDRSVYANLTKKDLPRGRWRYLDESEVIQLKHLI